MSVSALRTTSDQDAPDFLGKAVMERVVERVGGSVMTLEGTIGEAAAEREHSGCTGGGVGGLDADEDTEGGVTMLGVAEAGGMQVGIGPGRSAASSSLTSSVSSGRATDRSVGSLRCTLSSRLASNETFVAVVTSCSEGISKDTPTFLT